MRSLISLPKLRKPPKLFLLRRVVGDSMLPALPAGTLVLGVRFRKIRTGDIVIFEHRQLEKIKRVKHIKPDEVYLLGDDPSKSTDSRKFGWIEKQAIIAKVVWPKATKNFVSE